VQFVLLHVAEYGTYHERVVDDHHEFVDHGVVDDHLGHHRQLQLLLGGHPG
jgi:hypothetical protein